MAIYRNRSNGAEVSAWSVQELIDHVQQWKVTPDELLPWVRKRKLVVSVDHKDNVIVEAFLGKSQGRINSGDILVLEEDELTVFGSYEFWSEYFEPVVEPEPNSMGIEYSLVMPFITVTSKGGMHEDQAYTAGWEMGLLYGKLASSPHEMQIITIRTENVPQADLILMHYGYNYERIQQEPDVPKWTRLVLIPKEES